MKQLIISLVFLAGACYNAGAQIKATTEDNKDVLLYDDGTWKYAAELTITDNPFVMPAPSFTGKIAGNKQKINKLKLKQVSSKKNAITDEEEWFADNNLSLPVYEVPNSFMHEKGNIPDRTPASYKSNMLVEAIYDDNYTFLVYGTNFSDGKYLIITDKAMTKTYHVLDFSKYAMAPKHKPGDLPFINQRVTWAAIEDSILYVSHRHRTYAESSKGMNAYITAINLNDYSVIWRSKPLACNSANFEIIGDIIVCGYGFTNEKDYLFTLNKYTGGIMDKIKLKSGPDYIIKKGNNLYVRTYDTDYVFSIN